MFVSRLSSPLICSVIYVVAIVIRLLANHLTHPAVGGDLAAFESLVLRNTIRDICVATGLYAFALGVSLLWKRKR